MSKATEGGILPPLMMQSDGADAPEADGKHPAGPGCRGAAQTAGDDADASSGLVVIVQDACPAVRETLAALVGRLLPGVRLYADGPDGLNGQNWPKGQDGQGAQDGVNGQDGPVALPVSTARLIVRLADADIAVPSDWRGVPVAEVLPRAVDGEHMPASAASVPDVPGAHGEAFRRVAIPASAPPPVAGQSSATPSAQSAAPCSIRIGLNDVALALARCSQLCRVAPEEVSDIAPRAVRLSGAALAAAVPEVLRPLLPGVRQTAYALVDQACNALATGDFALLSRVGHTLRGMADNYVLPECSACSAALERAARDQDKRAATDLLVWLRAACAVLPRKADSTGPE